jgi:glycosyltransferase involved in cell wall biosynthesis
MADLYVMPSVSEPFGIAPLEALQHSVPVLISKQSGIAEALQNALKVDFWDIEEMANKIVAVLRHPPLQEALRTNGRREAARFRWEDSAARVNEIYHEVVNAA